MTLAQANKELEKLETEYGYGSTRYERIAGEIRFVEFTVKIMIDNSEKK